MACMSLSRLPASVTVDCVHLIIIQFSEQKSHLRTSRNIQGLVSNNVNDYGVNKNSSSAVLATVINSLLRSPQKLRTPVEEDTLLKQMFIHFTTTGSLFAVLTILAVMFNAKSADYKTLSVCPSSEPGIQRQQRMINANSKSARFESRSAESAP